MAESLQREWRSKESVSSEPSSGSGFSVLTYNILAECNLKEWSYPFCPATHRGTYQRHPQLMVELKFHEDTDVICLQEVETEYFHQLLAPSVQQLGFQGHHFPKVGKEEGVAIFYKVSSMALLHHQEVVFKDIFAKEAQQSVGISHRQIVVERCNHESVALAFTLRHRCTGKVVCVLNVHLFWKTKEYLDVNTLQAAWAVRILKETAGQDVATIACGDFNHTPDQPGYDVVAIGNINNKSLDQLQLFKVGKTCLVDLVPSWFHHSHHALHSAYSDIMGREPSFTVYTDEKAEVWQSMHDQFEETSSVETAPSLQDHSEKGKSDPDKENRDENCISCLPMDRRTLDYIWYDSNYLSCQKILDVVDATIIKPLWACPNRVFPSDHMLLKAEFSWNDVS